MKETMTTIVGNIITDLRPRRTADGVHLVGFRVASNERRFDKVTGGWVDGDRLFVSVTCWRKLAQGVVASLGKGDPVVVIGRLYTRNYEVENQKRSVTELDALAVGPDLSRCTAVVQLPPRDQDRPAVGATVPEQGGPDTEEAVAPGLRVVSGPS